MQDLMASGVRRVLPHHLALPDWRVAVGAGRWRASRRVSAGGGGGAALDLPFRVRVRDEQPVREGHVGRPRHLPDLDYFWSSLRPLKCASVQGGIRFTIHPTYIYLMCLIEPICFGQFLQKVRL